MTDTLRLLLIAIGVAANAVVWFRIGSSVGRARLIRDAKAYAAKQEEQYSLSVLPHLEEMKADAAEMMREMEFYANASDSINCTTWGKS